MTTPEERISALETGQRQLGEDIRGLAGEFRTFAGEIRSSMVASAKPQWATIISALALVVTIGALAFAPVVYNLQRLDENAVYHERLGGHPELRSQVQGIVTREDDREISVRREMALRDMTICERLAALEEKTNGGHGSRPCEAFGL